MKTTSSLPRIVRVSAAILLAGLGAASAQPKQTPVPPVTSNHEQQPPRFHREIMMKSMGMTDSEIRHFRILSSARLTPYDPAFLLAAGKTIDLTKDQAEKLRAISDRAIADAKALLTPAQATSLQVYGEKAISSRELCRDVIARNRVSQNSDQTRALLCPAWP